MTMNHGRRVAVLAADGFDSIEVGLVRSALDAQGARVDLIAPNVGWVRSDQGLNLEVDRSLYTARPEHYEEVFVAGGADRMIAHRGALRFLHVARRLGCTINASASGRAVLEAAGIPATY
jgi:catalase